MLSMADIAVGAIGGASADQASKFIEHVRGEEAAHTTHFHKLLEEQRDFLEVIANATSGELHHPINDTTSLLPYPQSWPVPDYHKPHFCIFIGSSASGSAGAYTPLITTIKLYFEIPGAGIHIKSLSPGWNQIDLPPQTLISTADGQTYPCIYSFRHDPIGTSI